MMATSTILACVKCLPAMPGGGAEKLVPAAGGAALKPVWPPGNGGCGTDPGCDTVCTGQVKLLYITRTFALVLTRKSHACRNSV